VSASIIFPFKKIIIADLTAVKAREGLGVVDEIDVRIGPSDGFGEASRARSVEVLLYPVRTL
jgi:hypothetical protein